VLAADAQVELASAADPMTGAIGAGTVIDEYLSGRTTAPATSDGWGDIRVETVLVTGCASEMIYERDLSSHHRHVGAAVRAAQGRLLGAMTLNPLLGLDPSLAELRRLVTGERFRAVRLAPGAHSYLPHRCADLLGAVCEEAAGLGIPVMVAGGNPPYATPVLFADLAAAHPRTPLVLCNLGSGRVSYAEEAVYVARHHRNVVLTTAGGTLPDIREAFRVLGPERLLFGSGMPEHDPWSQLHMIMSLGTRPPVGVAASRSDLAAVCGGNLRRLLGSEESRSSQPLSLDGPTAFGNNDRIRKV
jgi:predicted TIM-barrel fold metal-dependent hydrolase